MEFAKYLRGLDGRGHFWTVLVYFRRRALYDNRGKYQNLKEENREFLFT